MTGIEITFDQTRMDFERTFALIRDSCWGSIRREAVDRRAFAHSVCAIALEDGEQIGFARASGDRAYFARISDVIVWPQRRGRGIGKALVEALLEHPELATVSIWTLNTSDAHELYARYGFAPSTDGHEMRLDRTVAG